MLSPRQPGRLLSVVVPALVGRLPPELQQAVATPLQRLLEGPPEAVGAVLVDRLEHEQDAAGLEDGGAYAGGDAASPGGLAGPGAAWVCGGEKDEESIEHPDDLSSCLLAKSILA